MQHRRNLPLSSFIQLHECATCYSISLKFNCVLDGSSSVRVVKRRLFPNGVVPLRFLVLAQPPGSKSQTGYMLFAKFEYG